jgi:hypothetical protein
MERFGYKTTSNQLSTGPVSEHVQLGAPNSTTPIVVDKKSVREDIQKDGPTDHRDLKVSREEKGVREPKQSSPVKVTDRASSVETIEGEQRKIYEVVNIRLDKPSKEVLLQVRYGPSSSEMEWIKALEILDADSLAALQKAMIKAR